MGNEDDETPSKPLMGTLLKEVRELITEGRFSEIEDAVKQIVGRDILTGILNRIGFLDRLEVDIQSFVETTSEQSVHQRRTDETRRATRPPLCIAFLDLDKFKQINNDVGYTGGDIVLKTLATYLVAEFRKSDIVGRIYGDEFAVALRDVTEETVRERLQNGLSNVQMKLRDHAWTFTDSDGNPRSLKKPVTFTVDMIMLNDEENFEKVLRAFKQVSDGVLEKKKS